MRGDVIPTASATSEREYSGQTLAAQKVSYDRSFGRLVQPSCMLTPCRAAGSLCLRPVNTSTSSGAILFLNRLVARGMVGTDRQLINFLRYWASYVVRSDGLPV